MTVSDDSEISAKSFEPESSPAILKKRSLKDLFEDDETNETIDQTKKISTVTILTSENEKETSNSSKSDESFSQFVSRNRIANQETQKESDLSESDEPIYKPVKKFRLNNFSSEDEEEDSISEKNSFVKETDKQKEKDFPFEKIDKTNISKIFSILFNIFLI